MGFKAILVMFFCVALVLGVFKNGAAELDEELKRMEEERSRMANLAEFEKLSREINEVVEELGYTQEELKQAEKIVEELILELASPEEIAKAEEQASAVAQEIKNLEETLEKRADEREYIFQGKQDPD